jgi:hypothetical protein
VQNGYRGLLLTDTARYRYPHYHSRATRTPMTPLLLKELES